jgi:hypothetical protein
MRSQGKQQGKAFQEKITESIEIGGERNVLVRKRKELA